MLLYMVYIYIYGMYIYGIYIYIRTYIYIYTIYMYIYTYIHTYIHTYTPCMVFQKKTPWLPMIAQSFMSQNGWKILLFWFHNFLTFHTKTHHGSCSDAGCLEYLMVFQILLFGSESRHQTCVGLVSLQRKQLTTGKKIKNMRTTGTTIHHFSLSVEPYISSQSSWKSILTQRIQHLFWTMSTITWHFGWPFLHA